MMLPVVLPVVLAVLLAWLLLSVLVAALFSLLARRMPRENRDWDRELREFLTLGTGAAPVTAVAPSPASDGLRPRRASSPRRGAEGMAEFRE